MTFVLGTRSREELRGVHGDVVKCVEYAIGCSSVDFAVHDGLRTLEQQREYVRVGVSRTLNSKHLPQADGLGHAVDLVPYVGGKLRWEWPLIYPIAAAMWEASEHYGVELVWGGCWDRPLEHLEPQDLEAEVAAYVDRRRTAGRSAFTDGPHFELFW